MRKKPSLKKMLLTATLFYLLVCLVMYLLQRSFIYYPAGKETDPKAFSLFDYQIVKLPFNDKAEQVMLWQQQKNNSS